jgi:predicted PP-loop superfamily ATPase
MALPRERRAMGHQRADVRRELRATIDRLVDGWREIEALAVWPQLGGESRGGSSSAAERSAARVVAAASDWVERFERLRREVRQLDGLRANLVAVDGGQVERGRVSTIEPCGRCGLPPAPKAKRIDGVPYCSNTCYFRVWRSLKDDAEPVAP